MFLGQKVRKKCKQCVKTLSRPMRLFQELQEKVKGLLIKYTTRGPENCNALLQFILNAAARVLTRTRKTEDIRLHLFWDPYTGYHLPTQYTFICLCWFTNRSIIWGQNKFLIWNINQVRLRCLRDSQLVEPQFKTKQSENAFRCSAAHRCCRINVWWILNVSQL